MMYDEFGNYVGPELESDDEDDDDSPDEQEVSFLFCFHEFFQIATFYQFHEIFRY